MQRNEITGFKVPFDIREYADILPEPPLNQWEIINYDLPAKQCVWIRNQPEEITHEYIEQEVTRVLRTGVWIYIHKQLIWIPPNYYFFLQYFKIGGEYAEFRLSRLMAVYFQIRVRNNPYAIGTFVIKSRQIGETSFEMSNILHEAADGNTGYGSFGVQSKTNQTVKDSCWRILKGGWQSLPKWLKETLYSDFASGDSIETKIKFKRSATKDKEERDVEIMYGSSGDNTLDSMNNVRLLALDECLKWRENSFYNTLLNYTKFIAPGRSRKGLFRIFSSPADFQCKSSDEGKVIWDKSNPENLNEYGVPESRIFRYYASPLHGIQDMIDIYGDADADEIYKFIMEQRASVDKDKLLGEIRAYPLNEQEMFDTTENNNTWSNADGIKERMAFLIGNRFKDNETKEPALIYGNLQWVQNIPDNPEGVEFRQADTDKFDLDKARFAFSYLPTFLEPMKWVYNYEAEGMRPVPPRTSEYVIGIDPFDKRFATQGSKGISNGSMVAVKFLDFRGSGVVRVPTVYYSCRPQHINTFFEDAIKLCVFMRAPANVENKNTKILDWFQDRNYYDWLLATRGEPSNSEKKGDAPASGGAFLNEMISLIDDVTNVPITPDSPYSLEKIWHYDLLKNIMELDVKDTQKSDGFMAWGQAMIGMTKLLLTKPERRNERFNKKIFEYIND